MAYQNVGTPRFYIDWNTYHNAMGIYNNNVSLSQCDSDGKGSYRNMGMLNPVQQRYVVSQDYSNCSIYYGCDSFILDPANANWCGLFGHNLATQGTGFEVSLGVNTAGSWQYPAMGTVTNIINANPDASHSELIIPELDGFSIAKVSGADYPISDIKKNHLEFRSIPSSGLQLKFGAWCVGNYYDMPHSPDLSLKLSYEYDGVKTQQSKGGATLSNALYTKPADWGDYGCWQLGNNSDSANYDFSKNYRSGRRVWDLSFSYLSSSDLMPSNSTTNNLYSASHYSSDTLINDFGYTSDDVQTATTNNGAFRENILSSNDFFSQVWNRTMGGHLPFIFQPNSNLNLADQFAICRFDMDSLQYDQVANNVYNVKLKIRESW